MKLGQRCKYDPTLSLDANFKELMYSLDEFYFGKFEERYRLLLLDLFIEMLLFTCQGGFQSMHIC